MNVEELLERDGPLGNTNVVWVKFDGSEYRVPGEDGSNETAYYTTDANDARDVAKQMHGDGIRLKLKKVSGF